MFEPRPSVVTIANAMDCGDPSNFDRLRWLYGGDVDRMRADIAGSVHTDDQVCDVIRRVDREQGYLMDPHTAIAYLGIKSVGGPDEERGTARVFLATAHPAKFREVVEPVIGRKVDIPSSLAAALAAPPASSPDSPDGRSRPGGSLWPVDISHIAINRKILAALSAYGVLADRSVAAGDGAWRRARSSIAHEFRRLRARPLAGEFPRYQDAEKVIELRRRYWVKSVPARDWLVDLPGLCCP